jgi:probable phosphoglycerate mutase
MLSKIRNPIKDYAASIPEFLLQFDGCSKGNPGLAGAGAAIFNYKKEIWGESRFIGAKSTNNEAEYNGLIMGLEKAIDLGIKDLSVEGDSLLVIKQMTGEYKVKSETLYKLYNKAKGLEKQFDIITFTHIYRTNNKRADELSNLCLIKS